MTCVRGFDVAAIAAQPIAAARAACTELSAMHKKSQSCSIDAGKLSEIGRSTSAGRRDARWVWAVSRRRYSIKPAHDF